MMRRLWGAAVLVVAGWLTAGVLHRASHAPWRCDEDCPKWGRA